jgi:hypothetical protein
MFSLELVVQPISNTEAKKAEASFFTMLGLGFDFGYKYMTYGSIKKKGCYVE